MKWCMNGPIARCGRSVEKMIRNKRRESVNKRPVLEGLEPRLLFSADVLGGIAPVVTPDYQLDLDMDVDLGAFGLPEIDSNTLDGQTDHSESETGLQTSRIELVLVDGNVTDHQQLTADLLSAADADREIQVVVLDGDSNGIEQIGEALNRYSRLDAVHLISHGSNGGVQLGDTWLDANTLSSHVDAISRWGDALNDNADLLFYGCNLVSHCIFTILHY